MHFGRAFPHILQAIWEADTVKGPVLVSKLDVTYAYQSGNIYPSQSGAFAYVVPLYPDNDCIIICVDLVLPMGWLDSPKFFCAISETFPDAANALAETELPITAYGPIAKILITRPAPSKHTQEPHPYLLLYG